MKKVLIHFTYTLMLLVVHGSLLAQSDEDASFTFTVETGRYAGISLPYRKAVINPTAAQMPLIVYLHGGTSKGTDNVTPLTEAGIDSIADYLQRTHQSATFLVPQCPQNKSWGGTMNAVIKGLIDHYAAQANVDAQRIYLLGGSMGGTGTWSFLSAYPHILAAAMPVAGNPSRATIDSVALTPIYIVMGTADTIMSIPVVTTFTDALRTAGGEFLYDIETDWTHEQTCIESYTTPRLDWLFAHVRQAKDSLTFIAVSVTSDACSASNADAALPQATDCVAYYSLTGQRLLSPPHRGAYIERRTDNGVTTAKVLFTGQE